MKDAKMPNVYVEVSASIAKENIQKMSLNIHVQ
jgi:hypothetical protein